MGAPGRMPCGEWTGDGKALQQAINAAIAGKRPTVVVDGRPGAQTCKAAEWLRDNGQASVEILKFVTSKKCGCGLKRAPCGITGPVASETVKKAILDAGVKKGYPREDVNRAVLRESGWHASALNCQGADKHPVAGGLLQMLDSVARANGFEGNIDQFAALTAEEQLPYILKFISKMPPSTLHLPGDFGLALFTPAYVGKPNDFVIYDVETDGWEQNPGLRTAGNGPVTAGSVRATAD